MKRGLGLIILQVAVALFLLASGVTGLLNSSAGDLEPVVRFLNGLFESRSIVTIMIVVLSVFEIIAGFFLLTELFTTDLRITDMILFIFIILWIANIVLVDFIAPIGGGTIFRNVSSVLRYMSTLSSHLMVLGALILVSRKFA
ncbi:hypothetical protein K7J14_11740 [Treponema zuelzerae]|uniref:Uncharacterized protein n=1 Tax=Teretinema zuelzerae TaxID=156 RepID=A0AAE3EJ27_9SPIR|nr:hypothetical protein [Teretinema zuelzerae]MBN2811446.1 hypothetical protein [Spirochaetales bacterium]MCD1655366.1 hypothetical protein [Teretinema zuelzerae]HPO02614.1 hypothetical protein [Treponemataceae bacterium]